MQYRSRLVDMKTYLSLARARAVLPPGPPPPPLPRTLGPLGPLGPQDPGTLGP